MIQLRIATITTMMNTTIQVSGILNFFFFLFPSGGVVTSTEVSVGCVCWIFSFSITKFPPIVFY